MKKIVKITGLAAFALAFVGTAPAQDAVTGKWQGQFDSQIGLQKYTYEFKADGTNLTGRAVGITENGTNNSAITEGKINKDEISFVEPLKFGDNDIRIEYTGKVSGDEIKLHRKVGDFAEEDLVAKRVKESRRAARSKTGGHDGHEFAPGQAIEFSEWDLSPRAKPAVRQQRQVDWHCPAGSTSVRRPERPA